MTSECENSVRAEVSQVPAHFGRCIIELHFVLIVSREDEGFCREGRVPGQRQGDGALLDVVPSQDHQLIFAAAAQIIFHLMGRQHMTASVREQPRPVRIQLFPPLQHILL